MRQMKDSGIEWIGEIPDTWKLCKGRYLFKQRNLRGNNIEMQLLSPTQKFGVIPQGKYEELSGMSFMWNSSIPTVLQKEPQNTISA